MKPNISKPAWAIVLISLLTNVVQIQASDYAGAVTNTPNLLGYWRFDPVFQTNSCVNAYTGTLQGNAQIGPPGSGYPLGSDLMNQALLLDGVNSYLTTSLTGQITNQGTVLAWVYLTAQPSTARHIFQITSQSQSGNDFDLEIQTDNHTYFFTDSGSSTVYAQPLPLNQWHFLAATFIANSTRCIYLDGQLVTSSTAGSHSVNNTAFWIGNNRAFGPRLFQGRIDEVAVFNRALTASEIATVYSQLPPQTITWTNAASGSWNTEANWNPNTVPGLNDTVIITNAGVTVSLNGATTVGTIVLGSNDAGTATLSLAGQTLSLNGSLTVNPSGSLTVDSGVLVGSANAVLNGNIGWSGGALGGILTLAAGSTLNLSTANNHDLNGMVLTNNGSVAWTNGTIRSGNGTLIVNNGLWDCQSDQTFNQAFGGAVVTFNNYGTLRKSGGASEFSNATIFAGNVFFNQLAGVIDVKNGTNGLELAFQGGGNFAGGYITTNQFGLTVLSAGNFNLNGTVTGTNTWEDAGNLAGTNVIHGALTWMAGDWSPSYFVTITTNSTLLIAGGSGNMNFNGVIITNNGTVEWSIGTLGSGNAGGIYNYGLFDCQSDQTYNQAYGGAAAFFNNYGTLRKSGGASEFSTATFFANGVVFNQLAGVIDVQNGTNGLALALQGGGNLTSGYITSNQFGLTLLSSGNFNLNGTVTGTNTWENNGNLTGTNVIKGALTWVGGSWNGASSVIITTNSLVTMIGGSANMYLYNCVVTNYGTFVWGSGNPDGGGSPGTVVYNYGLCDCQSDYSFKGDGGGAGTVFNNYGTFRKTGGASEFSTATIIAAGVYFNQLAGVIDVQNGTNGLQLALEGSGSFTGGYITTNTQGLLNLASGNFIVNGTVTGTNTWLNGGNLVGDNVIQGALTWMAGSWNGTVDTIATNSNLLITGANNHDLPNCTFTNNGTVTWSTGEISSGGGNSNPGTTVYNNGLWNAQDDSTWNDAYGFNGTVFNNYGTFRKTGGASEFSTATIIAAGVYFNQLAGVMDVQDGNISLQGAYSLANGRLNTGINSLTSYGTVSLAGAAALTGTLSANLNNGFIPAADNSFSVVSYGAETGQFTSTALPLGFSWTTNYGSTTYTITVTSVLPAGSISNLVSIWQSGDELLQFSGTSNSSYTILSTTNLTVPRVNWTPLGQASQQVGNIFQYLDTTTPSYPQRFYQIRSP